MSGAADQITFPGKNLFSALRLLAKGVVNQNQRGHGFDHRHGAGQDTRIMPAAALQGGIMEMNVHGVLLMHDRGYWLEGDSEINGFAVGNAALNARRSVRDGAHLAALHAEGVIMLPAREQDAVEPGADVK